MFLVQKQKSAFIIFLGLALLLFGYSVVAKGEEVSEPLVPPHEFLTFGHFDGIELEDNGFPAGGHRHIGLNQGDVYVDDTNARSGTHSLYIEGTGANQGNGFGVAVGLARPMQAGKTYKFTLWYRAPEALATGQGSRIYARISTGSTDIHWDANWFEPFQPGSQYNINLSRHLLYMRVLDTARQDAGDPSDWHPIELTFTLPPDLDIPNGVINLYNDSDEPLWVDDLSFQLVEG